MSRGETYEEFVDKFSGKSETGGKQYTDGYAGGLFLHRPDECL